MGNKLIRAKSRRRAKALSFGDICELTGGRAVLWKRRGIPASEAFKCVITGDEGYYTYLAYMVEKDPREAERIKSAARRPRYYEAENARRRALAAERRKVRRRSTTSACPTPQELMEAWEHVGESHEATMRFGSLLEDLACYVDSSLRFDDRGDIVGRNAGIKGWLHDHVPELSQRYSTVMRYKAAAKKLRQITELRDPTPVAAVTASPGVCPASKGKTVPVAKGKSKGKESYPCLCDYAADEIAVRRGFVPEVDVVRARAIWMEVIDGIGDNPTALMRRIDALLDPKSVDDANMLAEWREKYSNEITLRTKSVWWRKLMKKTG